MLPSLIKKPTERRKDPVWEKDTSVCKDVMGTKNQGETETNLLSCAIQINAIRLPDEAIDTMAAFHASLHKLAE
jgi:hypothetical protein